MLRASDLELAYARRSPPVLRGVSLEIRAGELWTLLGRNGSGKTTLLRALLGLLPPRSGRIERRDDGRPAGFAGYIPQRFEWSGATPLSVREFLELGLVGLGVRGAALRVRTSGALESVGLAPEDFLKKSLNELSQGQLQRTLIARALARRPRILLADEPSAALDPEAARAALDLLDGVRRDGRTAVVLVTHQPGIAAPRSDFLALAEDGRIFVGTSRELQDSKSDAGRRLQRFVSAAPVEGALA